VLNGNLIQTGPFSNCDSGECAAIFGGSYEIFRATGDAKFMRRGAGVVDTTHYYVGKCAVKRLTK
jgi:hypothetical protein